MSELNEYALRPDKLGGPLEGPAESAEQLANGKNVGKSCQQCFTGAVLPGEPRGEMRELASLKTYFTPGRRGEGEQVGTGKVIVIATDAFGLGIPNPKIIADRLAEATGYDVWVPDLLEGDYPPMSKLYLIEKPIKGKPLLERAGIWVKVVFSQLRFVGATFFYRHRRAVLLPLATRFCTALKKEKGIGRIGMVGYCLGGEVSTCLAGAEPLDGLTLVDVAVTAHPGFLKIADFEKARVPFALICAEEDFAFDSIRKGAIEALRRMEKPTAVLDDHPGTVHGFAARSDLSDPNSKEQFEKALYETLGWLQAHL
ncbi:Alpha/Beta hydrolase protein [Leucosporidium creatinivorum]|uniref:Alpha/Beta hydrolase protein n=1 Tax=Leucosporidium creatinivorum TaxID=106004 RepID=A0A1Y2G2A9_9BASI|nr:Alpha/Beta hydrolase protein [Leucosporidium creatinivorum]